MSVCIPSLGNSLLRSKLLPSDGIQTDITTSNCHCISAHGRRSDALLCETAHFSRHNFLRFDRSIVRRGLVFLEIAVSSVASVDRATLLFPATLVQHARRNGGSSKSSSQFVRRNC